MLAIILLCIIVQSNGMFSGYNIPNCELNYPRVPDSTKISSYGSNIHYCTKSENFKLFGIETKFTVRIEELDNFWTSTGTGIINNVSNQNSTVSDYIFPFGTFTTTSSIGPWFSGWTITSTTTSSVESATTTTTSTIWITENGGSGTSTSTSSDGSIVITTTSSSTLTLSNNEGTASTTSTTTSGGTVTTTTTTSTFDNIVILDNLWIAYMTTTSSSSSGGVVTTTTSSGHIMAIKNNDLWQGSISIYTASASSGSSNTNSFCYQFTLPGSFSPQKQLSKLWIFISSTWKDIVDDYSNVFNLSNHLNIFGIITNNFNCKN